MHLPIAYHQGGGRKWDEEQQRPGSRAVTPAGILLPPCSWLYLGHPFQTPPPAAGPRVPGLRLSLLPLHTHLTKSVPVPSHRGSWPGSAGGGACDSLLSAPGLSVAPRNWSRGTPSPLPSLRRASDWTPASLPASPEASARSPATKWGRRQPPRPLLRLRLSIASLGRGMAEGAGCTADRHAAAVSLGWRLRGFREPFPGERPPPPPPGRLLPAGGLVGGSWGRSGVGGGRGAAAHQSRLKGGAQRPGILT